LVHANFIHPEHAYTLGACFGIPHLEATLQRQVVRNFHFFLFNDRYPKMLMEWAPEKLLPLVTTGYIRKEFPDELKMHDIIMMCEKVTFNEKFCKIELIGRRYWESRRRVKSLIP
jgi:hypothetical protein